jgi:hypothetical protein
LPNGTNLIRTQGFGRRRHFGDTMFYFPLATCLLLSVILSLVLWLFGRGHR